VHHKTALQWAVERVASLGSVDLVRLLLDITSTPAQTTRSTRSCWTARTAAGGSATRYRADSVDRLLNVAYELTTDDEHLRHELIQLLTKSDSYRRPASAAGVIAPPQSYH